VRYADEARFQQTCEQYAKGKREIQRSIEEIERCSRELTEAVNGVIGELGRFRDQECEKLREMREKLEKEANEAMEEVKKTLSQDDPLLKSDLAKGLRNYQPGIIPSFTFDIRVQPFQMAISSFLTYTIVPAESDLKQETPGEVLFEGLRGSAATVAETPLCERLSLAIEGAAWAPLPNMSVGRKRFSPC
jgi:ElaB/YqjD/DUF883 family membrane-anchored ribosome-binding protein